MTGSQRNLINNFMNEHVYILLAYCVRVCMHMHVCVHVCVAEGASRELQD